MSTFGFFIILTAEFLYATDMLDIISDDGLLHATILFIASLLIIFSACLIYNKTSKSKPISIWNLLKKYSPIIIAVELILLYILRVWIFMSI
ncbi:MAG: hypothetical protein IJA12_07215 [Oscillospiraceae bacterium]|nr:hypothetical protein [Oscillospiraceae bacterium]